MADTGAPWNLPYPLPTDLVRDGADAIKDLAEATATGLSAAGSEGIGPNVVSVTKTDVFTRSSSLTPATVDGLSVTITPSSDTSKILVFASVVLASGSVSSPTYAIIARGGTPIVLGDADGSRSRAFTSASSGTTGDTVAFSSAIMHLDAPGTASPVTYDVRVFGNSTQLVNRSRPDANNSDHGRYVSTLTVIEVAA